MTLLVDNLAQARGLDVPLALKDIAARERKGSTFFRAGRYGVAVSHAVTSACKQLMVGAAVVPAGIAWDAAGKNRVQVIFLLLGPEPTQSLYLKVLSRISHLCENSELIES